MTDVTTALIVWLMLMGMYARILWRTQRQLSRDDWIERGVVLGALGGLIGFMLSGFVHYNWGDSEVVMIFYLIMGLSLVVERQSRARDTRATTADRPSRKWPSRHAALFHVPAYLTLS